MGGFERLHVCFRPLGFTFTRQAIAERMAWQDSAPQGTRAGNIAGAGVMDLEFIALSLPFVIAFFLANKAVYGRFWPY